MTDVPIADLESAGALPVNEIFQTIQGEGHHTGRPAVFVRLQGCPVGCPFCDTRFTWDRLGDREIDAGEMVTKDHSGEDTWAALDVPTICDMIAGYRPNHVVLTGGEPAMFDLRTLTRMLLAMGRTVQIETSGTFPIRVEPGTWVTVSPKINMPGGFALNEGAMHRANEIKMPVGKEEDIRRLIDLLANAPIKANALVYVQPLSLSKRATQLCVDNAIANNWRVSLQSHALAGWR